MASGGVAQKAACVVLVQNFQGSALCFLPAVRLLNQWFRNYTTQKLETTQRELVDSLAMTRAHKAEMDESKRIAKADRRAFQVEVEALKRLLARTISESRKAAEYQLDEGALSQAQGHSDSGPVHSHRDPSPLGAARQGHRDPSPSARHRDPSPATNRRDPSPATRHRDPSPRGGQYRDSSNGRQQTGRRDPSPSTRNRRDPSPSSRNRRDPSPSTRNRRDPSPSSRSNRRDPSPSTRNRRDQSPSYRNDASSASARHREASPEPVARNNLRSASPNYAYNKAPSRGASPRTERPSPSQELCKPKQKKPRPPTLSELGLKDDGTQEKVEKRSGSVETRSGTSQPRSARSSSANRVDHSRPWGANVPTNRAKSQRDKWRPQTGRSTSAPRGRPSCEATRSQSTSLSRSPDSVIRRPQEESEQAERQFSRGPSLERPREVVREVACKEALLASDCEPLVDGTLERLRTLLAKTKKERPAVTNLLQRGSANEAATCHDVTSLASQFFTGNKQSSAEGDRLRKAKQYVAGLEAGNNLEVSEVHFDEKENSVMAGESGIAAVKKLAAQAAELSKADAAYDAAQAALKQPNASTAVVHQACATNQKASPFAGQTNKISFAQPGCFSDSAKRFLAAHQKVKR